MLRTVTTESFLRMGRIKFDDLCTQKLRPTNINLTEYNYSVGQVGFWDGTHPTCRIGGRAPGPQSKVQRQFLRDINTQKPVPIDYDTTRKWVDWSEL